MIRELIAAEQAIQETIEKFVRAWNVHDPRAYSLVFAEDADFTNVFGQTFHGRQAIEAQHAPIFLTMFKSSHLSTDKPLVRLIGANMAAVDVFWYMTGATDPLGNAWPDRKGLMNLTMRNDGGNWLILIMHNMDLPAFTLN
jgi:uncharacterized protein (TIGR02246 family)